MQLPTIHVPAITFEQQSLLLLLVPLVLVVFLVAYWRLRLSAPGVRWAVPVVRTALLAALVVGLADPHLAGDAVGRGVVFAVDVSDSLSAQQQAWERSWVAQAIAALPNGTPSTVVEFARGPQLSTVDGDATSSLPTGATDIASALRLAGTLAQSDGTASGDVVLLSDGWDTTGNAVPPGVPRGVHVSYVSPPATPDEPAAVLSRLTVAPSVRAGDAPDVTVDMLAAAPTAAHLRLTLDNARVADQDVSLTAGSNEQSFAPRIDGTGFHQLSAVLTVGDHQSQLDAVTVAGDTGHVLVLENQPGDADALVSVMASGGLQVDRQSASSVPPTTSPLASYDALVLVDTPATSLTLDQQRTLQSFAQDLGRGLIVVGGQHAFSPGGYEGTVLDDVLPVSSTPPIEPQLGSVALFLVIDRSGSMDLLAGSETKMAMAREAAMRAAELLQPNDELGIIAFDSTYQWVVPPMRITSADDVLRAKSRIDSIRAGGGTSILPPVQAAMEAAAKSDAPLKHVVLMTDGESDDRGWDQLFAQTAPSHITLSTLAIGSDADRTLLASLAQMGGGRSYYTERGTEIPRIAAQETNILTRNAVIEGQAATRVGDPSPMLRHLSGDFPTLTGYIATTRKDRAVTALETEQGHPLLAHWQYGLGRVVAWTSDAQQGWTAPWANWSEASQFWSQVVGWAMPAPQRPDLQAEARVAADGRRVTIDAQSVRDDGHFGDLLDTRATIVAPDGTARAVPMAQSAPGAYQVTTTVDQPGVYRVLVTQTGADGTSRQEVTGFAAPDSPELHTLGINTPLLQGLAASSGGRELQQPSDIAQATSGAGGEAPNPLSGPALWPWLIGLALVLLPIDVYLRRRA
jgi:uncharacterized membrane protein/Mg-chelatase subunit ChlD